MRSFACCRSGIAAVGLGILLIAATTTSDVAEPTAALKEVIAGANQEGTLTLSWAADVMGGSAATRLYEDAIKSE